MQQQQKLYANLCTEKLRLSTLAKKTFNIAVSPFSPHSLHIDVSICFSMCFFFSPLFVMPGLELLSTSLLSLSLCIHSLSIWDLCLQLA